MEKINKCKTCEREIDEDSDECGICCFVRYQSAINFIATKSQSLKYIILDDQAFCRLIIRGFSVEETLEILGFDE